MKSFLRDNADKRAAAAGVSLVPGHQVLQQLQDQAQSSTKMTPEELEKVAEYCGLILVVECKMAHDVAFVWLGCKSAV